MNSMDTGSSSPSDKEDKAPSEIHRRLQLANGDEMDCKEEQTEAEKEEVNKEVLYKGTSHIDISIQQSATDDVQASLPSGNDFEPKKGDAFPLNELPSAKDRGYAWIIVFSVFLINVITAGYVKSFGITFTLILDYFPDASGAASGWIMGLLVGCRALLSPVMGALTVVIGARKCVIIGTLICVSGLLLAVPAFSIIYIAVTLGGIVGTGMCLTETPGFIVVTDYFEEKRTLANGFRAAGNPMGGVLFAPMVVFLNNQFGLKGTFIMLAGLMLQLVVVGMFMRPFEQHKKIIENRYLRKNGLQVSKKLDEDLKSKSRKKKPLDFSILKNPAYIIYLLMVMCVCIALPNALLYTPAYGRSIGLSDFQNSIIASYTSLCDFAFRLGCGWVFNKKSFNNRHGFIAGIMIGGIGCLMVPLCSQIWHLLIFATMLSICMASFWTLLNVLMADQFGPDAMPSTWGFFRMLSGICNFFYPTVIGLVSDLTGGLTIPYMLMGSICILGGIIFSLQPLVAKLPGTKVNIT